MNLEVDLIDTWKDDPDLFCRQILGMSLWSKQREILQSVQDCTETFVPSCNGAGKTEIAAATVLWWLLTRKSKVVTTAPTWRQVKNVLWGRIHAHIQDKRDLFGGEQLATALKIAPDWEAIGVATTEPGKFQGFHSPGGVLIVVDEAGGVTNPELWGAIDGCLVDTKSRLLAIGNPTSTTGEFYARCSKRIEGRRNVIQISAFDVPNVQQGRPVIDGLVEKPWVDAKLVDWGEDSPLYQSRILGEFPKTGSDALYPLAWLEAAFDGRNTPSSVQGERVIAMDVARKGADSNAICAREGMSMTDIEAFVDPDTMSSANRLLNWLRRVHPHTVRVDAIGVGGPVLDRIRQLSRDEMPLRHTKFEEFVANAEPFDSERFRNLKAEAYWIFRDLLREGAVDLSRCSSEFRSKIERQAMAIRYEYDASGRLKIEDKQLMRNRVGYSPDELEAVIMCFYQAPGLPVDGEAISGYSFHSSTELDADPYAGTLSEWDHDFSRFELPLTGI